MKSLITAIALTTLMIVVAPSASAGPVTASSYQGSLCDLTNHEYTCHGVGCTTIDYARTSTDQVYTESCTIYTGNDVPVLFWTCTTHNHYNDPDQGSYTKRYGNCA